MAIRKSQIPRFNYRLETKEGPLERALAVLHDPRGLLAWKAEFLRSKGLSGPEIMQALNTASGGELSGAAGLEIASGDGE